MSAQRGHPSLRCFGLTLGRDHHAAHSQQAKQIVNGQIKAQLGQRQYPVFPTDRPTLVNSQDGIDRPW